MPRLQVEVGVAREAGDGIKPGVERSGTPGFGAEKERARETGDSRFIMRSSQHRIRSSPLIKALLSLSSVARSRGLRHIFLPVLGFRVAPPQALCHHPLRGFFLPGSREGSIS